MAPDRGGQRRRCSAKVAAAVSLCAGSWSMLLACLLAWPLVWPLAAGAAPLEGVLSPGPVIRGHEKIESDCTSCHAPFAKNAQDSRCLACHKEVGRDLAQKTGYHGRIKVAACRTCHTDHQGRDARIVLLDEASFDHAQTDFLLRAGHLKVACAKCHVAGAKFRAAPTDCVGCHRKDDVHKGQLGPACGDCHAEKSWKETTFDHDKTHFPLRDKHVAVACRDCHQDPGFKNTPSTCIGCHRKDDEQHGHHGHFGERCETCHGAKAWKEVSFNHDTDTRYPLRGAHVRASCASCHAGDLYRDKLPTACIGCHRKDDELHGHHGSLGERCADCHTERSWKESRIDHDKTSFPLRGKHAAIECNACHKSPVFKEAPSDCVGCHRKDDDQRGHHGKFGARCQDCHDTSHWATILFNHDRDTHYPLRDKHAALKCGACHTGNLYTDKLQSACIACHRKDDKHNGQEGERCEQCHVESGWKTTRKFDHALTSFPLLGKHAQVTCAKCHTTAQYKDAPTACSGCHAKDDAHKRRLGTSCQDCHNARDWKAWDFDHGRRTRFVLDGSHLGLACEACHKRPAADRATLQLPLDCASCHGADDVHDGSYGKQCERCHLTTRFKDIKQHVGRGPWCSPSPACGKGPG